MYSLFNFQLNTTYNITINSPYNDNKGCISYFITDYYYLFFIFVLYK